MARRRAPTEQQAAAYARQAVDEVADADDLDAAARRVLGEAPNRRFRQAILETSSGAPDEVTAALVRAALQSGDDELGRVAADLLMDTSESEAALAVLEESLASDDGTIRRRAVEALENFDEPGAVALFHRALTDEEQVVRRSGTAALSVIVGTPFHPLREAMLELMADPESELARAIIANPDEQVRRMALQGLAFADSDRVLPIVESLARDEDVEVRQEVVLCLAALGSEEAVELMGRQLEDPSYRVASAALDMLAARLGATSSRLLELLQLAMEHPAPEVRRHAVLMLDRFDASQAGPVLEKATRDADFEVARRAGEMLRKVSGAGGLGWLGEEIQTQAAGQRALPVWEAGNVGLETSAEADLEQIIPILERAVAEGAPSDKVHAINEMAGLLDIADSPAMREALGDRDPSVQSRAADALAYTRDAGLLVEVLRGHEEPTVRRRAVEALAHNPGGPPCRGRLRVGIDFTSTRTVGMELYGRFLDALRDEDEGVRESALTALRRYPDGVGLCPVRRSVEALDRVAEQEGSSFFMQELAGAAADEMREIELTEMIAESVESVLDWRGSVAREAHALRRDAESGVYRLEQSPDPEALARTMERYDLSEDEADALRVGLDGDGRIDPAVAGKLITGYARDLSLALDAAAHGARALGLVDQEGWEESLENWARAVLAGPGLEWGESESVRKLLGHLARLRRRAWVEAVLARQAVADDPSPDALEEAAADDDDWVRLVALTARCVIEADAAATLDELARLCEEHAGEDDFAEPVGRAAVKLLGTRRAGPAEWLQWALEAADLDARMELTMQATLAAQKDEAASELTARLAEVGMRSAPGLCMALALRGAGADAGQPPAELESADDPALRGGALALRAMDNDAEAAEELERWLREGDNRERYYSAWYLSLARVRSAVLIFASVRDQEAPYMLRGLCAASLIRHGHADGPTWFAKVLKPAAGEVEARLLIHLCRAVEGTIPLMLQCNDVNVGRFV